jgi:hypothetical protein
MDEPHNISTKDLRTMIHGLKMTGFAFVDKDALQQIELRIKDLPPPEELERINDSNELKHIIKEVGEIMRLVEIYGKRGHEYKVRHKSKTGLPPRYKVLEWSKNMNKASIVKEFVKVSEKADGLGNVKVASKLIVCAKRIRDNTIEIKDIEDIEREMKLSGMEKELALMKEAGFMDVMKGIGNMGKDVGQAVSNKAKQVGQSISGSFNVGVYKSKLGNIQKKLKEITTELGSVVSEATKAANSAQEPHKTKLVNIVSQLNDLYSSNEATNQKVTEVVKSVATESTESTEPTTSPTPQATTPTAPTADAPVAPVAPVAAPTPQASVVPAAQIPTAPVVRPFSVEGLDPEQQKEMLSLLASNSKFRIIRISADIPKTVDVPTPPPSGPPKVAPATTMPMKGSRLTEEYKTYIKNLPPEEKKKLKDEILAVQKSRNPDPTQAAPQAQRQGSGDPEADKYLSSLKKEPGNADVYTDNTGSRVKIVPAANKYRVTKIA